MDRPDDRKHWLVQCLQITGENFRSWVQDWCDPYRPPRLLSCSGWALPGRLKVQLLLESAALTDKKAVWFLVCGENNIKLSWSQVASQRPSSGADLSETRCRGKPQLCFPGEGRTSSGRHCRLGAMPWSCLAPRGGRVSHYPPGVGTEGTLASRALLPPEPQHARFPTARGPRAQSPTTRAAAEARPALPALLPRAMPPAGRWGRCAPRGTPPPLPPIPPASSLSSSASSLSSLSSSLQFPLSGQGRVRPVCWSHSEMAACAVEVFGVPEDEVRGSRGRGASFPSRCPSAEREEAAAARGTAVSSLLPLRELRERAGRRGDSRGCLTRAGGWGGVL